MCELTQWLANVKDKELREELLSLIGNERELEDRFYKELSFGTGGLRGVLGVGTSRMNIYTVGRATLGLAEYLTDTQGKSIVIAYDSRNKSEEFARLAAEIMSSRGIRAYLFHAPTPTPVLSFAVRYLGADAGIVITASHNPKEYNGYKVYNARGCQITDAAAKAITERIGRYGYFNDFTPAPEMITSVAPEVGEAFLDTVAALSMTEITEENAPSIVYSPLNGTGGAYVPRILQRIGIRHLYTVAEQEMPDGNFPTCPYPNPEEREALTLALRDAAINRPDMVMVTDPDADRIGIAVPDRHGEYVLLNGNETGSILLYYLLQKRAERDSLSPETTVIKTIVTTDIVLDMAKSYGIRTREVLTGFKYIGEAMEETEDYLLGLEESYGYLVGTHARDKDAVSAAMMIAEACAYFKGKGQGLCEVLAEVYEKFGYYQTELRSVSMPGRDGMEKMKALLTRLRKEPPQKIGEEPLVLDDFGGGLYGLPPSDVLRLSAKDHRIVVRPSGTEPKMKIYLQARGTSVRDAQEKLARQRMLIESCFS